MLPLPEKPDKNDISDLTFTQQFEFHKQSREIENASLDQLKELYKELLLLNYRQKNAFRQLSKMPP